jgi:cell division ATPase FtsA
MMKKEFSIRRDVRTRLISSFHVVTGQLSTHKILSVVSKAGLKVEDFVLEPIASAAAVLSEGRKKPELP